MFNTRSYINRNVYATRYRILERWFPLTPICPALLSFSLFLSPSFSLALPQRIILRTFPFTLSLVTCVTCARTRLTYIHEETSIIIDSKSRLKHRNAVACLYKIPKNTIPYHGLCYWMTLVTVRWLFVGSFSFRFSFSSSMLDTSSREKFHPRQNAPIR